MIFSVYEAQQISAAIKFFFPPKITIGEYNPNRDNDFVARDAIRQINQKGGRRRAQIRLAVTVK